MKNITIKSLELLNFRNIKHRSIGFGDGATTTIFGDNGSGKTTIADAISWLLYDRDSNGKAGFEIKPLLSDGKAVHNLSHEVSAVFLIMPDGGGVQCLGLKKVFTEKWTKKRGNPTPEFTGHTTNYFVDDVPVKQGEFAQVVEGRMASASLFQILSAPAHFSERLPWQERRKILLDVCGTITDDDVIRRNPELADLPRVLGGKTTDAHKKIISGRRQEINRELDSIPVRIDEATRSAPDLSGIDRAHDWGGTAKMLDSLIAGMESRRSQILIGGDQTAEIKRRIIELDANLISIRSEHEQAVRANASGIHAAMEKSRAMVAEIDAEISRISHRKSEIGLSIESMVGRKNRMLQEWREIQGRTYVVGDTSCPTCGQELPMSAIREAAAKFNHQKSVDLERNKEEGLKLKASIDAAMKEIEALASQVDEATVRRSSAMQAQDELQQQYRGEMEKLGAYVDGDEYAATDEKIRALRERLAEVEAGAKDSEAVREIEVELARLRSERDTAARNRDVVSQAMSLQGRVDELVEQEKKLAQEFREIERELFLIESFIRAKVSMLEESINTKFSLVKFKLFSEQINGGLAECCEVTASGVPYSGGLNTGMRINAGLDVIRTLSRHYGITVPVVIDNSESVTSFIDLDAQKILLAVSESDKKLRVVHHINTTEMKEAV